jgi:tetratricopeptide (TPR) repeat protein
MSLEDDDWEPAGGEHPTWSMEEIESHPLFMTNVTPDTQNEHVEALQSILFDDESPESLCNNFKDQGNEVLRHGLLEDARICYERALETGCQDKELLSTVHSNLAFVHLKRERYAACVDECYRAIAENHNNLKAYFRGALASLKLELYSQGLSFANGGLSIDGENNDIRKLLSELKERHALQQGLRAKEIENEAESKKPKLKYRWRD